MNDQIKTTDELYIAAKAILEGKWIISVANFKNSLSDISTLQNSLALAAKEYEKLGDRGGHGSGHYQVAVKMESLRKKLKDRYNALIEIQAGLMASGEMTKSLQKVFIDELEDHVADLQKQVDSRDDNNYIVKTQLRDRKAILAQAKEDLKKLK